jgi:predicted transcriptional regulator
MKQQQMKVLLSIKPEYANKIFAGEKKYEFRRSLFRNTFVRTVVVYASSPIKKVIGEFEIEKIINEDLDYLWELTKESSGITEEYFYLYFKQKGKGYAIKIKKAKRYAVAKNIKECYNISPPQSFAYLNKTVEDHFCFQI